MNARSRRYAVKTKTAVTITEIAIGGKTSERRIRFETMEILMKRDLYEIKCRT